MPWKKFKAEFKRHFEEVMKTKKGLRSIALGFSIGTFIAILPTPGFNMLLGLLIILIFQSISKYALFTAFFVFNGLVKAPIYIFAFWIGTKLFGNGEAIIWSGNLLNIGTILSKNFVFGILIINAILTIISYHFAYHFVKYCRKQLKHK